MLPSAETNISAFGAKVSKGTKTRVQLCYHTIDEYRKLSKDKKRELDEWRKATGQGKYSKENKEKKSEKNNRRVKFSNDKAFAAAVKKAENIMNS